MDVRKRLFATCAVRNYVSDEEDTATVDLAGIVLRLILFDKLILNSVMLREFPTLIKCFGYGPVRELLSSKVMDIYCDTLIFGQVNQGNPTYARGNLYDIKVVGAADRQRYIHNCMQTLHSLESLNTKQVIKIKQAIVPQLLKPLDDAARTSMIEQTRADIASNRPQVKTAVTLALKEKVGSGISASDFTLEVHSDDESPFRVESNISDVCHLSDEDVHRVVGGGLLAVGGLNLRLAQMEAYTAISGFKEAELPVFESKLDLLSSIVPEAEAQENRMKRILAIGRFGDLDERIAEGKVDLLKLLEIRDTRECREFRDWLWSADSYSNAELDDRINSLRDKLSWFVRGSGGKTIRWLASTGLSLGAGDVTGTAGGLLDTFLLDKILPNPGPLSFISNLYPTIFVRKEASSWAEGFVES